MNRRNNAFVVVLVTLLAFAVSAFENDDVAHHRTLQAVNFRQDLLDAINEARTSQGLNEVCINERLMNAAQNHANDMTEMSTISSRGTDGSTPKERAKTEGFVAETVTEVVAGGFRTAASVVAAWCKAKNAPETIYGSHDVIGVGYSYDRMVKSVHFWVVDFSVGECGDGESTAKVSGSPTGFELLRSGDSEALSSDATKVKPGGDKPPNDSKAKLAATEEKAQTPEPPKPEAKPKLAKAEDDSTEPPKPEVDSTATDDKDKKSEAPKSEV
ncbi:unnamed protein product [Peronospora belbahrii]|uniref:SCP domain-containing protein n=1 Tax=Peronospora belbahrii TaxID=622444 RepID=A0ABN8DAV0_9STRA|nr:unnamed protein product [Peronospora belbahrii]